MENMAVGYPLQFQKIMDGSGDLSTLVDVPQRYDMLAQDPYANVPEGAPTLFDKVAEILATKKQREFFLDPSPPAGTPTTRSTSTPPAAQVANLWNGLAAAHNVLLTWLSNTLVEMTPAATWYQDGAAWTWRGDKLYIMPLTGTQAKLPASDSCAPIALRTCPKCTWGDHKLAGACKPCAQASNASSLLQCEGCISTNRRLLNKAEDCQSVRFSVALRNGCAAALDAKGWFYTCTKGKAVTQCEVTVAADPADPGVQLSQANAWLLQQAASCERTVYPSVVRVCAPRSSDEGGIAVWIIATAVAGGVAAVLMVVLVWFCMRRQSYEPL